MKGNTRGVLLEESERDSGVDLRTWSFVAVVVLPSVGLFPWCTVSFTYIHFLVSFSAFLAFYLIAFISCFFIKSILYCSQSCNAILMQS